MPVPTVNVTVTVLDSQSAPVEGALVAATLNRAEIYQGIIVPTVTHGETDANGQIILSLFPNALGTQNSQYDITIRRPNAIQVTTVVAFVPNNNCDLEDISALPPYPGKPDNLANYIGAVDAMLAAEISAAEALSSENAAQASEDVVLSATADAEAAATAAATDASAASTDADAAAASAALAALWASAPYLSVVSGGEFSAKHWATVSQTAALGSLKYKGAWSAAGGVYPTSPAPVTGDFWVISVGGTISAVVFLVGDHIVYSGSAWDKIDNTDAVSSVNGYTGAVVLTKTDVGLSALTNSAQLKISSNLSDLGSVSTARTNLSVYSIASVDTALALKLPSTSYTAADVLSKIASVDGTGSGLDADLLDGQHGTYFLACANFTGSLADARLSANVPLLSGTQSFSKPQTNTDNTNVDGSNWISSTTTKSDTVATAGYAFAVMRSAVLVGGLTHAGRLKTALGAIGAVAIGPQDDDNTGLVFDGADALYVVTAGTARITVSSTGTVSIGGTLTAGNLSGTNTGDQTSIVGLSGTLAQFNTALSDADFATGGGTASGTNTGDQTITLTGDATGSGTGSFAVTLTAASVLAKLLTVDGSGTLLDADKLDTYEAAAFPRKAENAVVSGLWTFDGNYIQIDGAGPRLYFNETDQAADDKLWAVRANSKVFDIAVFNDAKNAAVSAMTITRGTGNVITAMVYGNNVDLPTHSFNGAVAVSGTFTANGNNVLGNASGDTLTVASAAVTWSGTPTHSGNHTFSGTVNVSDVLQLDMAVPRLFLNENDQAVDEKLWAFRVSAKSFDIWTYNDVKSLASSAFNATRGTGIAISTLSLGNATDLPSITAYGTFQTTRNASFGTTITTAAAIYIGNNTLAASSGVNINSAGAQLRDVNFQTAGVNTWSVRCANEAQSGADAGASFQVVARTDAGVAIDSPITVVRASAGAVTLGGATLRPISFTGSAKSTSPTGGVGYATGAGGAQTQLTSKATTVVSNTVCGTITLHNANLAATTGVTFTFTNSAIAATDVVVLVHDSVGTIGAYGFGVTPAAGSATITVRNNTAGGLAEAIVLRYAVIKAVVA